MMIGSATEPTDVEPSAVSNVAWTVHFYAWIAGYSTSLAVQAAALNKITAMQESVAPVPVISTITVTIVAGSSLFGVGRNSFNRAS
jgi:hypothetical protein